MSANLALVYLAGGVGSCLGMLLLLYNLVAAVLFLREETDGASSGLAKAAWALGLFALFVWWMPCVGSLVALLAMIVARVERGRIYRDESSLAGATPVRMGNVNAGVALLLQLFLLLSAAGSFLAS